MKNIKEVWRDKVESFIYKIGFDHGVYCFITANQCTVEAIPTEKAIPWVKHYIANKYLKYDPAAKIAFMKKQIIWNLPKEKNKIIQKIVNERIDYGMQSGVTVPIFNKVGYLTFVVVTSNKKSSKNIEFYHKRSFIQ
jgi:hypothetical protein